MTRNIFLNDDLQNVLSPASKNEKYLKDVRAYCSAQVSAHRKVDAFS